MKLLAIETSAASGALALLSDQTVIAEQTLDLKQRASTRLLPAIAALLEQAQWRLSDCDAIAVSRGPGSFTGVRVGIATAQGLALAHQTPVYAVSSLAGLAEQSDHDCGQLAVLRAAPGADLYACVYRGGPPWLELVIPEGRYASAALLDRLRGLEEPWDVVAEPGLKALRPESLDAGQVLHAQPDAVAIGQVAMRLGPERALVGGIGLQPSHFAPASLVS